MAGRSWFAVLAAIAVAAGLGFAWWRVYRGSQAEECYACQRGIHAHSRTVAIDRGAPRVFCCPACALSEHEQERQPIRITELTDFLTGLKLSPDGAFLVKGSDVNLCVHKHELLDADKRPAEVQYDRCAPSMLAFASRAAAMNFSREHGGEVVSFADVVASYSR